MAILAVAVSAFAYYISTGLGEFWPAAWLAPLPILILAFRASNLTAALAAAAAYLLGSLNLPYSDWGLSLRLLILASLVFFAIPFAASILAARYAGRRLPPIATVFVFPVCWTSCEFVFSRLSANGSAFSLAYSQASVLPLIQIASVTGIWGITFVITLIPSAAAVAWSRRAPAALIPPMCVLVLVAGYGFIQLRIQQQSPEIRVGLAASNSDIADTENSKKVVAVAQRYAARVTRLASQGASLVVLPEKFLGVTSDGSAEILKVLRESARTAHVTLIAGLDRLHTALKQNVAVVIGPDGEVQTQYEKRYLVPGIEVRYEVGEIPGVFAGPMAQWGVAICKDMDFPQWSRQYGRRGVQVMAVPAWDFGGDARLHSRMAVLRGVENGFAIVRSANGGLVTVSDAYGRILAEDSSLTVPEVLLAASVRAGPGKTLYSSFGDWFAIFCMVAIVSLLAASIWRNP